MTAVLSACGEDPDLAAGKAIFEGTCRVCQAQGINGAPIVGNKRMWGPRAEQGLDVLVQHASDGYGLMPAKGGNESLSEDDLRKAIRYMLSQLEEN